MSDTISLAERARQFRDKHGFSNNLSKLNATESRLTNTERALTTSQKKIAESDRRRSESLRRVEAKINDDEDILGLPKEDLKIFEAQEAKLVANNVVPEEEFPPESLDVTQEKMKVMELRLDDLENKTDDYQVEFEDTPFDKNITPFGYNIDGADIIVNDGEIYIGRSDPISISGGDQTRTITSDLQYVWLELDWSTKTITIASPSTTKPISQKGILRIWLGLFNLTNGFAQENKPGYTGGNLYLPANYGDI